MLVKNVGLRGRQKLTDMWEHCPYVVKRQSLPALPMYENASGSKPRVLHCDMLLTFTGLPCPRIHTPEKEKPEKKIMDQGDVRVVKPEPEESDSDNSSSQSSAEEEDEVIRPEPNADKGTRWPEASSKKKKEVPTKKREDQRGRPQRNRRVPKRFNKDEFVTHFTFNVPASHVTYL